MQAYFDRGDAELEHQAVVTKALSLTDAEHESRFNAFGRRRYRSLLCYAVGLGLLAMTVAVHIGSAEQALSQIVQEPESPDNRFIIEFPEPEPPKPKPKLKPEIKPEEPQPVERVRSVPDRVTQTIKPQERSREREEEHIVDRDAQTESTVKRSLPAVTTPTIAVSETAGQREFVQENIRQTTVSDFADLRGDYIPEEKAGKHRSAPETGLSHIQLDPYHYQMVNVCLRLCVRTMFTHSGIDEQERSASSDWLRIRRENDNFFEYRHGGRWVRFSVKTGSLGEISNIDFASVAGDWTSNDGAQSLLEAATKDLCRLLGYDDCLKRL
jgi:hypothetical protein